MYNLHRQSHLLRLTVSQTHILHCFQYQSILYRLKWMKRLTGEGNSTKVSLPGIKDRGVTYFILGNITPGDICIRQIRTFRINVLALQIFYQLCTITRPISRTVCPCRSSKTEGHCRSPQFLERAKGDIACRF